MPDTLVGVAFGLVAAANLVQGMWTREWPWLDLTLAGFLLTLLAVMLSLRHHLSWKVVAALLVLIGSLTLGFVEPALNGNAIGKRTNLILGVAYLVIAGTIALSNSRRLRVLMRTLVVLALLVLGGQFILPDSYALTTGRRTPLGLNAIGAARMLGAGLVIVLSSLIFPGRNRARPLLVAVAVALTVGLFLAGSRGPLVGVIIAVILMVFNRPDLRPLPKIVILAALGTTAFLAQQQSTAAGSHLTDLTTSGRLEIYSESLRIALENPFGVGWGNFFRYVPSALLKSDQGDNLYAHNIILEFFVEAGVVGGLLFLIFLTVILRQGLGASSSSVEDLALAALAISLLAGAMLSSDVVGNRMMWVVFAAILGRVVAVGVNRHPRRSRSHRLARRPEVSSLP